jgi:hypothetical protein
MNMLSSAHTDTNEKVWAMTEQIEWISTAEAETLTGFAQHTIAEMCRRGELNCLKIGKSWAVDKQAVLKLERSNSGRPKLNRNKRRN